MNNVYTYLFISAEGAVFPADLKSSAAKSHGIDLPDQEKNFRIKYFPISNPIKFVKFEWVSKVESGMASQATVEKSSSTLR